ncbi:DUF4919 domain-containing protein [Epilithonimonas zeae]|uniref:DUF4919 domain-containing protein n=1 Tax=Epilithonimonas zeae TaxID=1416779 RepID=UPI00200D5C24|nr:DUF4919 domain-containing protein [Epilithonimonas zeae]UQB68178.1 DUF4919 domain-containing protein [Epilithonimonas zeae]
MMKQTIVFFSLLLYVSAFCQINTEEIKKKVLENPKTYYYDYLEIFKMEPAKLTQQELNQMYYGSRFIESEYQMRDYNQDYEKIWKLAKLGMSKNKALKIVEDAQTKYNKNPLLKGVALELSYIYKALGNKEKSDLYYSQNDLIDQTIENSGTGKSEDSPICVIRAGDMISKISSLPRASKPSDFKQKMTDLADGSILTTYSVGDSKIYIKLVGGF